MTDSTWIIVGFIAVSIAQLRMMYRVRRSHHRWVQASEALERVKKFKAEKEQR